jgi:bifunctional non-homologous end joining protein LigD
MVWRVSPARSRRTPPAGFVLPAQPRLVDKPPAGLDWTHEIKQDGFRLLARKEGQRVTLWTRHGTKFTDRLPRIAEAVRGLPVENVLIDGEAVALRPDGHSDFEALRTKAGAATAAYVAFDLMRIEGKPELVRLINEDPEPKPRPSKAMTSSPSPVGSRRGRGRGRTRRLR